MHRIRKRKIISAVESLRAESCSALKDNPQMMGPGCGWGPGGFAHTGHFFCHITLCKPSSLVAAGE